MGNRIRILATGDVRGRISPYNDADGLSEYKGFARLSTLIDALRDEDTIVVDNGNALQGSALMYYHALNNAEAESPVTAVMNHIGYDYVNLGNHDFDSGMHVLCDHLERLSAPCITSNLNYKGKPFCPTYVITETAGKKIALFGLITPQTFRLEKRANVRGCRFLSALETAKKTVRLIRDLEKPDYIICLYHGGLERDPASGYPTETLTGENEAYALLREVRGIDLLITGHQGRSLCGTLFNTVYTQTAGEGAELACIDIYTDTGVIEPHILKADCEPDEEILSLCENAQNDCDAWLNEQIGVCGSDLEIKDETDARMNKSQFITFVNQTLMELTGAQIAAVPLYPGAHGLHQEIAMRDLITSFPYADTVTVKKITGKVLKEYLEQSASFWSIRNDAVVVSPAFVTPVKKYELYDMADGIEYTIRVSEDPGHRIENLTYQGQPVEDNMEFAFVTTGYRAYGNGGYDMLKECPYVSDIKQPLALILADYIRDHQAVSFEPVHNIHVVR